MPISANGAIEGALVENYFDNLLPDSEVIRRRIRMRFRTKGEGAFELLKAIGRDCVGAVQITPTDKEPEGFDRLEYHILSDDAVARILAGVTASPGVNAYDADDDDFRISIAGAQEKTALLRIGAQWCRPEGATPTTHILKLPLGLVGGRRLDLSHSVENEWLCAQILSALGLPVAHCEIGIFNDEKALVVERFDRRFMSKSTWIARLPQEDFCQALGKPPTKKYESDGGPTMRDCLTVISGGGISAESDRQTFICAQLAFWLLAATDGHAKNFSLHISRRDQYKLTPLYDVVSAWPIIGSGANQLPVQKARMAMAIHGKNTHYKLGEIHRRHWQALAKANGGGDLWQSMDDMVRRLDSALNKTATRLPPGFPGAVSDAIFVGARRQAEHFKAG